VTCVVSWVQAAYDVLVSGDDARHRCVSCSKSRMSLRLRRRSLASCWSLIGRLPGVGSLDHLDGMLFVQIYEGEMFLQVALKAILTGWHQRQGDGKMGRMYRRRSAIGSIARTTAGRLCAGALFRFGKSGVIRSVCVVVGTYRDPSSRNVDHIYPVRFYWSRRYDLTNLQMVCWPCNRIKQSLDCSDYRSEAFKVYVASIAVYRRD
jgi:HNH endonuclease